MYQARCIVDHLFHKPDYLIYILSLVPFIKDLQGMSKVYYIRSPDFPLKAFCLAIGALQESHADS